MTEPKKSSNYEELRDVLDTSLPIKVFYVQSKNSRKEANISILSHIKYRHILFQIKRIIYSRFQCGKYSFIALYINVMFTVYHILLN